MTNKNDYYLYYKSAYGNQTWQNDDFPWWAPTYNVTLPFYHMALWETRFTYRRKFSTQTLKSFPTSCLQSCSIAGQDILERQGTRAVWIKRAYLSRFRAIRRWKPPKQRATLKFWECENAPKNKKALRGSTSRNSCLE